MTSGPLVWSTTQHKERRASFRRTEPVITSARCLFRSRYQWSLVRRVRFLGCLNGITWMWLQPLGYFTENSRDEATHKSAS